MQKKQRQIFLELFEEIKKNISPEEYEKLEQLDEYQLHIYIYRYYKERYSSANLRALKEFYNMEGAEAVFVKQFQTSAFAHSNLLYVQALAHLKFPRTHYTTREGMDSYLLLETVSGSGVVQYAGKVQEVTKGDIIFLNCRKKHHYEAKDDGWEYRIVHYNGSIMPNLYEKIEQYHMFVLPRSSSAEITKLLNELFENGREELPSKQELLNNSLLTQILTQILIMLPEQYEEIPQWIADICDYLDVHFQPNILECLENEFYRSKYYICHEFKKYVGVSVNQYQMDVRLRTAQSLLLSSGLSLEEIAILIGYENVNSFHKAFQKKYGITPGRYRKNQLQGEWI